MVYCFVGFLEIEQNEEEKKKGIANFYFVKILCLLEKQSTFGRIH